MSGLCTFVTHVWTNFFPSVQSWTAAKRQSCILTYLSAALSLSAEAIRKHHVCTSCGPFSERVPSQSPEMLCLRCHGGVQSADGDEEHHRSKELTGACMIPSGSNF